MTGKVESQGRRVAQAECKGCHHYFPKPAMKEVRITTGYRKSGGTRSGYGTRNGKSVSYSITSPREFKSIHKMVWMCVECDTARKKKMLRNVVIFFGCLILAFIALILVSLYQTVQ